jgi:hypothetical protein
VISTDRQSPLLVLEECQLPDPPNFLLKSTFKKVKKQEEGGLSLHYLDTTMVVLRMVATACWATSGAGACNSRARTLGAGTCARVLSPAFCPPVPARGTTTIMLARPLGTACTRALGREFSVRTLVTVVFVRAHGLMIE